MAETFKLPIDFNGQEYEYPTQVLRYGFTHKVQVDINRALTDKDISLPLLQEISKTLSALFN